MKNKSMHKKWGEVCATLLLTILFCFVSCNITVTSGTDEPEIVAEFELNGDAIRLYDDNTFAITLKDNAGTISGTYTNVSDGYRLTAGKDNGSLADPDDILKLKVTGKEISVGYSDFGRYSTGEVGEQTGGADFDDDYSLGDTPEGNRLSEEYFNVKDCADGIYLECTVPAGTWQTRVYIDGVGQLAEEIQINEKKNKGTFFYPFLDPGKEYTIRFVFLRDEDKDDDGFVINYINGDGSIAWFETKVKAGAKSKGFVRLKDCGDLQVESNGDFRFTKRPTFENENHFAESGRNWIMDVALVEGVSWEHEGRKTKWGAAMEIPQDFLSETQNLYTAEFYWKGEEFYRNGGFSKVGFICYRPVLHYEYGGKTYKYLWGSKCLDTPHLTGEAELYTNIDVSKPEDVEKIKGTWIYKSEWDNKFYGIQCHRIHNATLVIDDTNVKHSWSYTYTKLNGSAFTAEELIDDIVTCSSRDETVASSKVKEFESELNNDPRILKFEIISSSSDDSETYYKYKVYTLNYDVTLSSDNKTLIQKYENKEQSLSEYFGDHKYDNGYTRHCNLRLFYDGSILRIITSGKDYGEDYNYCDDYKRQ